MLLELTLTFPACKNFRAFISRCVDLTVFLPAQLRYRRALRFFDATLNASQRFETPTWAGWDESCHCSVHLHIRCDAKALTLGDFGENHIIFCKKGGVKSGGVARFQRS